MAPLDAGLRHASVTVQLAVRRPPVLLVHYPKSGSTWLRSMILTVLLGRAPSADELQRLSPAIRATPTMSLARLWSRSCKLAHTHEPISRFRPRWARTKMLYLVRDPRDVAASYLRFKRQFTDQPIDSGAFVPSFIDGSVDGHGTWGDHVQSFLEDAPDGLLVRYEDLVAEPVETLAGIMRSWLGQSTHRASLMEAVEANRPHDIRTKLLPIVEKHGWEDPASIVGPAAAGHWGQALTDMEANMVFTAFAGAARRAGYHR